MKVFGELRVTTNQLLLVNGNIPDDLKCFPTFDIRLLFNESDEFGGRVPSRFLSLFARRELPLDDAERDTITVFGELSEKPAFDEVRREDITVPLLTVSHFVRHNDIALRAFELSQSCDSGSLVANWLRAESELLSLPPKLRVFDDDGFPVEE